MIDRADEQLRTGYSSLRSDIRSRLGPSSRSDDRTTGGSPSPTGTDIRVIALQAEIALGTSGRFERRAGG
jgi:hypothetical protein